MKVINSKVFENYNIVEKGMFEAYRLSVLKIIYFPQKDFPLTDEFISFAENAAIEFVNNLPFEFVQANKATTNSNSISSSNTIKNPISTVNIPNKIGATTVTTTKPAASASFSDDIYVLRLKDKK